MTTETPAIPEGMKLLPCPFCDARLAEPTAVQHPKMGLARLHPGGIEDDACPLSGWGFYAHQLAAWNTRAPSRPIVEASAGEEPSDRAERYEDALQQIVQWADAYPVSIFPEPDFAECAAALKAVGQTLDAVSASNMRHVVEGVGRIARAALAQARP